MDSKLTEATQEILAGHQYLNVRVRGQAHDGDAYDNDWRGIAMGRSHL